MDKNYLRIGKTNPILYILSLILVASFLVSILGFTSHAYGSKKQGLQGYEMVYIKKNDNLWDIARTYNSSKMDMDEFLGEIREINDLKYRTIYPGDLIKVPIY